MNAFKYEELIRNHLSTCRYLEDRPHFPVHIQIPASNPNQLYWQEKIPFLENLCLSVMEHVVFDEDQMAERAFSYDLRERGTGNLVWRIDNHNRLQPVTNPCHVHIFPDTPGERIECFLDSSEIDFGYAIHCVVAHFEGRSQMWDEVRNDES